MKDGKYGFEITPHERMLGDSSEGQEKAVDKTAH